MNNRRRRKRSSIQRKDGWENLLVGLGKVQDKSRYTNADFSIFLTDQELGNAYMGGGFPRTVIDVVAEDMTGKWIEIPNDDDNKIQTRLELIKTESIYTAALKWQRLYGGSIIIIGAADGNSLDQPLNEKKITAIEWLKSVDRTEIDLFASEFEEDPMNSEFGKPKVYTVRLGLSQKEFKVHRSRVIEFFGELVPSSNTVAVDQETQYWGSSVLQSCWDQLRNLGGSSQAIMNILYEFIIGKYTLKGLSQKLATGQENKVIQRMEIINMYKSIINAVLLDEGENYVRDSANVAGLDKLMEMLCLFLSGVTGIPLTKLFGRAPAGLNATGESDMNNYYDKIIVKQRNELKHPLQRLVNLIAMTEKVPGDHLIKFNPLVQMTEKELAEIGKLKAETYNININLGIYDAQFIQETQFPEVTESYESRPEMPEEIKKPGEKENAIK